MKELIGKFFIISDLENTDFMKDEEGKIAVYDSETDAMDMCGFCEFEKALVCEITNYHIESETLPFGKISQEQIEESKERQRKRLGRETGRHFGYPTCCIKQFCESNGIDKQMRFKASKQTGFVPCSKHAKEILEGKITLESLIKNRKEERPFPNGF